MERQITITSDDLKNTTCQPSPGDAVYLVAFTRDMEADYCEDESLMDDHARGIEQLHSELQEACDEAGLAGNFVVLTRSYAGETIRTKEAS